MTMTRARHKARVPWWHLRRRLRETLKDLEQLARQHRQIAREWAVDRKELDRLRAAYEPVPVLEEPSTSWAAANAAFAADVAAFDPDETMMIPVYAVGVDPSSTGPDGITVFRTTPDGITEMIEIKE